MNKLYLMFLFISLSFVLNSCFVTYGNYTNVEFSALKDVECNEKTKAKNVEVYFEGEEINFEYERIGFVEAQGSENANNDEVIAFLKYQAWINCANAVINVKKSNLKRETGNLLSDKENINYYNSNSFSGIAVRIMNDSSNKIDTSFINIVRSKRETQEKQTENEMSLSILGFFAVVFGLMIYYLK